MKLPRELKDVEHLLRVVGLFAAALVVFVLAKALLVPQGFGVYGHYRAGALADNAARPPRYAGQTACAECHSDVADARKTGKHARVACEACHGALARHAAGEDDAAKPQKPDSHVCLVCHQPNVAKPASFPQVDPKEHAGDAACLTCHSPHQPGNPPEKKP